MAAGAADIREPAIAPGKRLNAARQTVRQENAVREESELRNPIRAALAVLIFGTIMVPGCFYIGPWQPDPDRDERRERRRGERRGASAPRTLKTAAAP